MRLFKKRPFNYEYPIKIVKGYSDVSKLSISNDAIFRAKRHGQGNSFIVQYNEGDGRRTHYYNHPAGGRGLNNIYYEDVVDDYFPGIKKFEEDGITPIIKKKKKVKNIVFNRVIL